MCVCVRRARRTHVGTYRHACIKAGNSTHEKRNKMDGWTDGLGWIWMWMDVFMEAAWMDDGLMNICMPRMTFALKMSRSSWNGTSDILGGNTFEFVESCGKKKKWLKCLQECTSLYAS